MSVLIFLIVLSFLVIIHELGHFLSAKWSGMKVEEFGIGYPPRAKTLFTDKAGTEYTLNWLPFGGFVRLFGEDAAMVEEGKSNEGAFFTKPLGKRLVVVLAGAVVNFVFGVIAFSIIYSVVGIPADFGYVRVDEIAAESPAETSGLRLEDEIEAVVIEEDATRVTGADQFVALVGQHRGETIRLVLKNRADQPEVYVRTIEEVPEGQGSIGVVISDFGFVHYPLWEMPVRGAIVGTKSAIEFGAMLIQALGDMVRNLFLFGQVPKEVAGPVGIAHSVAKAGILEEGFLAILNFTAILSINLAIMNVLPLPALDGGRAVFLVYELIFRRRVKPAFERTVNTMGFVMLLTLIVLVSVRDVKNIFLDEAVRGWLKSVFR
jgi:regulator of sigma E protease